MYDNCLKVLSECRGIRETGDSIYLIGVCLFRRGDSDGQAMKMFENCLGMEWI